MRLGTGVNNPRLVKQTDWQLVVVSFYQLCVKVAVSVMGPPIVIEAGLLAPENEPVPLPVQFVKL